MANGGSLTIEVILDDSGVIKGFKQIQQEGEKAASSVSSAGNKTNDIWDKVKSVAGKAGTVIGTVGQYATKAATVTVGAISTIGAAITGLAFAGGVSRALAIDEAKAKMDQLGMDTTRVMENVKASVKETKYGLDEAATAAVSLSSSGVAAGDDMTNSLKSVAATASIAGAGFSEIGAIYAKVAAAGKLGSGEMNQLLERGVSVTAALSKSLGKTKEEVKELVKQGKVDFKTFSDAMYMYLGDASVSAGKTFEGAFSNMQAAIKRIGADFASPALDALRRTFLAAIPAIDALHDRMKPIIDTFTSFVNIIASHTIGALNNFTTALQNGASVTDAFKGLIQDLEPALRMAAGGFKVLVTEGLRFAIEAMQEILPTLLEVGVGVVTDLIAGLLPVILDAAPIIVDAAFQLFIGLCEGLTNVANGNLSPQLAATLAAIGQVIINNAPALLNAALTLFGSLLNALVDTAGLLIVQLSYWLATTIGDVINAAPGMLSAAMTFFGEVLASLLVVVANVTYNLANAIGTFVSWVARGASAMLGAANTLFETIVRAAADAFVNAVNAIVNFIGRACSTVAGAAGQMAGAAAQMIQGMVQGVFNGAGAVIAAIQRVCSNALDAVRSFFGIHSPSKVMQKMFGYVMEGGALGVEKNGDKVVNAMSDVVDEAMAVAENFAPDFSAVAGGKFDWYSSGNAIVGNTLNASGSGQIYSDKSISGRLSSSTANNVFNFNGVTVNAKDKSVDDVIEELMQYAERSKTMMGVA